MVPPRARPGWQCKVAADSSLRADITGSGPIPPGAESGSCDVFAMFSDSGSRLMILVFDGVFSLTDFPVLTVLTDEDCRRSPKKEERKTDKMSTTLPSWFRADEVFHHENQWFFGSIDGLHVGPFDEKHIAQQRGRRAVERLLAASSASEQMTLSHCILQEEWDFIKQRSGIAGTLLADEIDIDLPPERVRKGEAARSWFRSERFFQVEDAWFFGTRENIDIGPFKSLDEAQASAKKLLSSLVGAKSETDALNIVNEFKHRATSEMEGSKVSFSPIGAFRRTYG